MAPEHTRLEEARTGAVAWNAFTHDDGGAGLGASHQTGTVATLLKTTS